MLHNKLKQRILLSIFVFFMIMLIPTNIEATMPPCASISARISTHPPQSAAKTPPPRSATPPSHSSSNYYSSSASLDQYGNSEQIKNAQISSNKYGRLIIAALSTLQNSIIVCSVSSSSSSSNTSSTSGGGAGTIAATTVSLADLGKKQYWNNMAAKRKKLQQQQHDENKNVVRNDCCWDESVIRIIAKDDYDDSISESMIDEMDQQQQQQHHHHQQEPCQRTITAVIFSGYKADGTFLTSILRDYSKRTWERYDSISSINRIADALSNVKLSFMKYHSDDDDGGDDNGECFDDAGPVAMNVNNDNDDGNGNGLDMSRPFGVQSLVIGVRPSSSSPTTSSNSMMMRSVDPSGVQQSWVAHAMGKNNEKANEMLEKLWKVNMSEKQVLDMCCNILRDVMCQEEEGQSTEANLCSSSSSSTTTNVENDNANSSDDSHSLSRANNKSIRYAEAHERDIGTSGSQTKSSSSIIDNDDSDDGGVDIICEVLSPRHGHTIRRIPFVVKKQQ